MEETAPEAPKAPEPKAPKVSYTVATDTHRIAVTSESMDDISTARQIEALHEGLARGFGTHTVGSMKLVVTDATAT